MAKERNTKRKVNREEDYEESYENESERNQPEPDEEEYYDSADIPDEDLSLEEYEEREQRRNEKNRWVNRPMFVMMWMFVLTVLGMFAYNIYFMVNFSDDVRSASRNPRRNDLSKIIERGKIMTKDGVVVAETVVDEDGNESRYYDFDDMYCHVVGYNSEDCGSAGIETTMNFDLLTSNVNIFKQLINELKEKKNPGNSVITTLDSRLQRAAYNAIGDNVGAAVVLEPDTGRILAMVSKPGYDPNEIEDIYYDLLDKDEEAVLLNRATQGLYAPGSTFKVVTALEFLREHPNELEVYSYECENTDIFAGVSISCHDDSVHEEETLTDSLAYSCNTSFANIGMRLDKGRWGELCHSLFFNQALPYSDGVSANSSFEINAGTAATKIPQTAIGQGNTAITPLHNAMIFSSIANGGVLLKPYLVEAVDNRDGARIKTFSSEESFSLMSPKEARDLTSMMKAVTEYGTASPYFYDSPYEVAGKTGTAEYDDEGHSNSWFVGFNNPDNPQIVVSVIIEKYDDADRSATYAAKQIFDAFYENN